jgi:hypothetical protein
MIGLLLNTVYIFFSTLLRHIIRTLYYFVQEPESVINYFKLHRSIIHPWGQVLPK